MKRQDGSTENVLSMKPLSVLHLRDRLRRRPDAVAIGPGLGQTTEARYWVEAAMALEAALVMDADALNVLASNRSLIQQLKQRTAPACITPHPGEAARLLGRSSQDVQAHREQSLMDLVELTGCVVVLKGQHSLLASPLHSSVQCMDGNPGMAADQLLMRGIGPLGMTASEVAFELRNVLNAKA